MLTQVPNLAVESVMTLHNLSLISYEILRATKVIIAHIDNMK